MNFFDNRFKKCLELIEKNEIKEAFRYFIEQKDYVTFVNLIEFFESHIELKGDWYIAEPQNPTIILWKGMSEEFVNAIAELLKEEKIFIFPTSHLTYMADGGLLKLPLARSIRNYKKPHWLPVCFRTKK